MTLPLPGIKIFVHGANSADEWYEQTEAGLCVLAQILPHNWQPCSASTAIVTTITAPATVA